MGFVGRLENSRATRAPRKTLKRMDDAKETLTSARNLSAAEKSAQMAQSDQARQNLLRNADGLDRLLFERKQENRRRIPMNAPTGSPLLAAPRAGIPVQPPG
jgi:aspartate carbamoyltransferase catalytic subunit